MNYIIIGASQGIGFEISKSLEKKNKLILCSRKKNKYFDKFSKNISFIKTDVTKTEDIKKLYKYLKNKKIKLDGAILCQGLLGSPINIYDKSRTKQWQKIFDTNFTSNLSLVRYILPFIKKKNYSKIIFFSGGGVFNTWPKFSAYSISKTALVRFAENLADEVKNEKIIVTCLAPGFINTNIHKENYSKLKILNKKYRDELINNFKRKPNFKNILGLTNFILGNKNINLSGRTISANFDPWKSKSFNSKLKKDENLFKLVRQNLKSH